MPAQVPEYDQFVQYVVEGDTPDSEPVVRFVLPHQLSLDTLLVLESLKEGYERAAARGHVMTLQTAEIDALQAAASEVYHPDVVEHEVVSSNPAVIVDALIAVRSRPEWHVGRQCAVGDVVFYAGNLWTCRVPHTVTTDPNWRPDVAPNLWRRFYDPGNPAWSYPTAYTGDNTAGAGKGDVVTYNGRQYRCLQSHASSVAWYPSAVGVINVLWVDIGSA